MSKKQTQSHIPDSVCIHNKEIIDFYRKNQNINIETINLFFIDIIKKLSTNLSSTLNDNNIAKLLTIVTDMQSTMGNFNDMFSLKLLELKKDYMEDVKTLLMNNSLVEKSSIQNILERNHDNLVNKTQLILNEFVPKTQEGYYKIESSVKEYFTTITENTRLLLQHNDKGYDDNNKEKEKNKLLLDIELQLTKMVTLIQQPICSFIQSSEERTQTNIQQMKENINTQQKTQEVLSSGMNDFLNKYKNNSSSKGNVSETELYHLLLKLLPTDEIIRCSSETASCDFKVNRYDISKPSILFENKNYTRSVDSEEIKKFERDVSIQKKHGIFLSQNSPITFKDIFHIDIINGLILVYIPNAEYDANKIKVAIDIIDKLSIQINAIMSEKEEGHILDETMKHISTNELNQIIKEYTDFGIKKMEMIEMIKSMSKQMLDKMEDLQLPQLNGFLLGTGQFKNNTLVCTFCDKFNGKNKSSLAAHMRSCKLNPTNLKKELGQYKNNVNNINVVNIE